MEAFREAEKEKDEEASRVRLRNVNLRLMLKKLEATLKVCLSREPRHRPVAQAVKP